MSAITQTELTTPTEPGLQALLETAGIARLEDTGWIRVTGEDRVRWLNGMVTNSISDLKEGEGCYNFVLSAQGRIQGILYAFALADSILLQTDRAQIAALLITLDRFIIMDDVELTDITGSLTGVALIGPKSAAFLSDAGFVPPAPGAMTLQVANWQGSDVQLIAAHSPLVPRFELWATLATTELLIATFSDAGAVLSTKDSIEHLRILEGTPRYGVDIRDKELPQETAQTRALHFAKGCYLGQEIVERIRSRGSVHRTFSGFRLDGTLPEPGTILETDGKSIGELTSVVSLIIDCKPLQLALGYIRREALDRGSPITYTGGTASPQSLPFPLADQNP